MRYRHSPLYTVKQRFNALGGATPVAIYGVLSLAPGR